MCDLHNEKEVGMCDVCCNNNISDKKMSLVYDTLMPSQHECCKLSHEHRVDRNYTIAVKWEAKAEAYKKRFKLLGDNFEYKLGEESKNYLLERNATLRLIEGGDK